MLVASAECTYIVMYVLIAVYAMCAECTVQCQVRRPYRVLHPSLMKTLMQLLKFCTDPVAVYTIIITTVV